ncbi:MAG: iron-sulfur cluster assembly scaffold protein [Desulfatibacillaceae bacterium]
MADDLDSWADQLQERIYEQAREEYSETVYRLWREPVRMGRMAAPDGRSRVTGGCGDTIEIYLLVEDENVKDVTFYTDGCATSVAAGSMAAQLAAGRPLDRVADISGEDVLNALDGLPEESEHCADLAAEALSRAVDDYYRRTLGEDPGAG